MRTLIAISLLTLLPACAHPVASSTPQPPTPSQSVPFIGIQDVFGRNAIGDAIVITSVHGTSPTVAPDNIYRIDGAYTLASHDSATLAAFVTATQPNEPSRPLIPGQSLTLHKGSGTFTLFLHIQDPGCPHVSFYPSTPGNSFAGEYFATPNTLPPTSWLSQPLASR